MNTSIVFIGGGNMSSAMVKGLLLNQYPAAQLSVVEPNATQAAHLRSSLGMQVYAGVEELPMASDRLVVWAVKPQVMHAVASSSASSLQAALHVSIAAGVSTVSLCEWLGTKRVVRAMPNTAAMVKSSVTGLFAATNLLSAQDRELVEQVVGGIGAFFWVQSDESMDAVTAITGSGPAYVFHFLEGLQTAAERLGFDASQARRMALLTAEGAVRQALRSDEGLGILRERVTSKGGTTAAALAIFGERGTHDAIIAAVAAAFKRAQQLAQELATPTKT